MRWKFWDAVAYSCLYAVAVLEAVEEYIKHTPSVSAHSPAFMTGEAVSYLPLLLVTVASVIFIAKHWPWRAPARPVVSAPSAPQFMHWPHPYSPVSVTDKKFVNERVPLDWHAYSGCRFENVTFVYNGTTAIQLNGSEISGSIQLYSDNPAVTGILALLFGIGAMSPKFNFDPGPGNRLERGKIDG